MKTTALWAMCALIVGLVCEPSCWAQASALNPTVEEGVAWYDVTQWGVEGRILPDAPRARWFDRFPAAAEGQVTSNVWNLSRDSAGMMVRFKTDSPTIHVNYELRS